GARSRHAGPRRARDVGRHPARGDVAPGALAADRRRARRGAQDGHRAARAEPLQAARAGRGVTVAAPSSSADHGLSDEQRAFVEAIRDFAERETWTVPEGDHHSEEVAAKMAELGWYG